MLPLFQQRRGGQGDLYGTRRRALGPWSPRLEGGCAARTAEAGLERGCQKDDLIWLIVHQDRDGRPEMLEWTGVVVPERTAPVRRNSGPPEGLHKRNLSPAGVTGVPMRLSIADVATEFGDPSAEHQRSGCQAARERQAAEFTIGELRKLCCALFSNSFLAFAQQGDVESVGRLICSLGFCPRQVRRGCAVSSGKSSTASGWELAADSRSMFWLAAALLVRGDRLWMASATPPAAIKRCKRDCATM